MRLRVRTERRYKLRIAAQQKVKASISAPVNVQIVQADPYTGSYTITPSAETQTLDTKDLRMTDNIVVNPIPSNYGLITTVGAGIRVS